MDLDDELCLCFHVTQRKVVNFLRVEKPTRSGQLSECFGAGTGCGWCRPFLRRLFNEAVARGETQRDPNQGPEELPANLSPAELTAAEYARKRSGYVRSGGGTPPAGATPIDPE
jgi:bacterioferritin-associated ferredoxin